MGLLLGDCVGGQVGESVGDGVGGRVGEDAGLGDGVEEGTGVVGAAGVFGSKQIVQPELVTEPSANHDRPEFVVTVTSLGPTVPWNRVRSILT